MEKVKSGLRKTIKKSLKLFSVIFVVIFLLSFDKPKLPAPKTVTIKSVTTQLGRYIGSREVVEFDVPENATAFVYQYKSSTQDDVSKSLSILLGCIATLVDPSNTVGVIFIEPIVNFLDSDACECYLLNSKSDADNFINLTGYNYLQDYSLTNYKTGTVKVNLTKPGKFYIGLRNPSINHKLNVNLSVVAIVK